MATTDVVQDLGRIGMPKSIFREIAQRAADTIVAERALADEAATLIDKWLGHVDDNDIMRSVETMKQIEQWLARYQEART